MNSEIIDHWWCVACFFSDFVKATKKMEKKQTTRASDAMCLCESMLTLVISFHIYETYLLYISMHSYCSMHYSMMVHHSVRIHVILDSLLLNVLSMLCLNNKWIKKKIQNKISFFYINKQKTEKIQNIHMFHLPNCDVIAAGNGNILANS